LNLKNKKEFFSEIINLIWSSSDKIDEIRLTNLKNSKVIISEIKTFKVIELDNLESFVLYASYDNYLIFKFENSYYFCSTELIPILGKFSLIKMIDYIFLLRKDKILRLKNIC
jgi:hypothetical protein